MADVEPVTPTAPRPAGRVLFTQGWRDVAFLHWAVDPARVAPLLPPGTRPDEHEGATYVGLVPFRMRRIGLLGTPGLPWLGSFLETNVRLYSVDDQGRRGVVFASLDAERLLPVLAARWVAGLPYLLARMRFTRIGDVVTYTSAHQTDRRGRTAYWPNEHPEWPLHAASVLGLDEDLTEAAGLPVEGRPDDVLFSPGVDVRFGPRVR